MPVPRRGQRARVLDEWFHEIRSDEAGIFVTYRKESQVRDSFGRTWQEDGDKDAQIQPPRAFDRAGRPSPCLACPVFHIVNYVASPGYKPLPAWDVIMAQAAAEEPPAVHVDQVSGWN